MSTPRTDSPIDQAVDQLFDAEMSLNEVVVDWATSHRESLEGCAASGCIVSAKFIRAVGDYFDRLDALETAETNATFVEMVQGLEVTDVTEDLHLTVIPEDAE